MVTGAWSRKASEEASKFIKLPHIVNKNTKMLRNGLKHLPL